MGLTFAEKILGDKAGAIVFRKPDLLLTHDNTASIKKSFQAMNGQKVHNPDQLLVVLDHNAPPTSAKLANDYQSIREFVREQGITRFYDSGEGICHQLIADHAKPGMIILGSDSHTCTAGAFNTFAAGIDRTEAAGIWKKGESWLKVPESIKIELSGAFKEGVFAKDLALYIIGMIGSSGANYMSIEFHGEGIGNLSLSGRMTLANLASEMGAKNAVFPADEVLSGHLREDAPNALWADNNAEYARIIDIDLGDVYPLVAIPHHVDKVKAVPEIEGVPVQQGLIGTCTNGRLEDLQIAAAILKQQKIADGFHLLVIPASRKIYLHAMKDGTLEILLNAGATILSTSCGPCLGTGQGIPADNINVISTANRNFRGRMGNKNSRIYLASPATVAWSAIKGKITDPRLKPCDEKFPWIHESAEPMPIAQEDNRKHGKVWNYVDTDHLNTDLMFAGRYTYDIMSTDKDGILAHLLEDFDPDFARKAEKGDIIIAGHNFGCGSSREHPAVGFVHAGIKAVLVKSVNRIFYRSAINQGLLVIVHPEAVESWEPGDSIGIDPSKGLIRMNSRSFQFAVLPGKVREILENKGLVNWIKASDKGNA